MTNTLTSEGVMHTLLASLASPAWWIGVVIVGVAINLLSAYLKPLFDSSASRMSTYWATRTKGRREARERRIAKLRDDPQGQIFAAHEESRHWFRAIVNWLVFMGGFSFSNSLFELRRFISIWASLWASALFGVIQLICVVFALMESQSALQAGVELDEARKRPPN